MVDVLVIGAGIFGLNLARKFRKAGYAVLVAEADRVGAGASATPLGVLAPHAPERWSPLKQTQFEALRSLPDHLAALEDETGIGIGYRRCGRLIPLTQPHHVALWQQRAKTARDVWQDFAGIEIDPSPDHEWLAPEAAPYGGAFCGLTARIDARRYLEALAASLGEERLRTGLRLSRLEDGAALFACGTRIAARQIVLATGVESFRFLPTHPDGEPAGRGEKGQAAVLRVVRGAVEDRPLIFKDGTYVVPRGKGHVAVGATSERDYAAPDVTDSLLDDRIEKAQALSPLLFGAATVERWAGVRPRAAGRRLVFGPHPSHPGVLVATGGFKTGLAMAHTLTPTA